MGTQETEDNNELLSRELVLSSLVQEVTRVMHSAPTLDEAMKAFLLGASELTGAQNMALLGLKPGSIYLTPTHGIGLEKDVLDRIKASPASGPVHECLTSHRHMLIDALEADDTFLQTGAKGYLLVPLTARIAETQEGGPSCMLPVGILWVDGTQPGPELTGQTISHLQVLAQQASLMIETWRAQRELAHTNAELKRAYSDLSAAQKIIEKDLDRAKTIQNNLLPTSFPDHLLQRVASKYIPAGMVGGDYYDCFELPGGNLGVVVADVSGHGIGAALVMSMFKVLLRTFSPDDPSPCSVLNKINATFMTQQLGAAQFVTAYYGIVDRKARRYTYCNAGHAAQLLLQSPAENPGRDQLVEMQSQGLVLGMFANTFLSDAVVELASEARLFLFTDGITEAHGVNGTMYGTEPLMQLALASGKDHPAAVIDALMRSRAEFLGGSVQATGELADDATVVIIDV